MQLRIFRFLKSILQSTRKPIRRRRPNLGVEQLEDRCVPTVTGFRPIDEVGNNVSNPTWGTASTDLIRISPVAYADGISSLSLPNNPSARVLSDILNNQADSSNPSEDLQTTDQNSLTDFGYVWGQFIDHDMDLTPSGSGELLSILADPNDTTQMGNQTFARSSFDANTGTSSSNPRQQSNAITSFLDLSQVYGSTAAIADALRTHVGGLLKTSPGNMLPYDNSTYFTPDQLSLFNMANDAQAVPTGNLFVTGDVRGNENVELTALQTLFVRNHNLLANQLQQAHPGWSDEQLYQEARKLNIAEYQMITYSRYLPDLLGPKAIPAYTGYNPKVNPSIATEFSTVAFRFGHSLLDNDIERQGNNGQDFLPNDPAGADLSLATDFFDPNVLNPQGVVDPLTDHISTDIGPILKANADGIAQADDLLAVGNVRNLLFGNGGQTDNGLDLIARDVERARDHGIGTYNQVRQAYGLAPVTSFVQITSDPQVQMKLQKAYGSVDNIDPFEGGLAEDHSRGSDMGPLFTKILADQFTRLRNGDRFFYLNESFNREEMKLLQQGDTLAKVIEANTDIKNLQSDVFDFRASISGTVLTASSGMNPSHPPLRGLAGVTVQLEDDNGSILATTLTDLRGQYHFDNFAGLDGTGTYSVRIVAPTDFTQTSADPPAISISRGDINLCGVNFRLTPVNQGTTSHVPHADLAQDPSGMAAWIGQLATRHT